jgi:hypothetical protein
MGKRKHGGSDGDGAKKKHGYFSAVRPSFLGGASVLWTMASAILSTDAISSIFVLRVQEMTAFGHCSSTLQAYPKLPVPAECKGVPPHQFPGLPHIMLRRKGASGCKRSYQCPYRGTSHETLLVILRHASPVPADIL